MTDTELMESTGDFLEKLSETANDAREAYDEDDLETAKRKLAQINNNIGEILMRVNVEQRDAEGATDD